MIGIAAVRLQGGEMRKAAFYIMLVAGSAGCLSACERRSEPQAKAKPAVEGEDVAGQDPAMAKKLAEAKAAYASLTPAEKAKLAAEMKKVKGTLPMSLADAGSIKIRPDGKPETTLAQAAPIGTPTLVAAWASWCIPCKMEARELARLRQHYGRDKLNIVYLNIGDPEVERAKGPAFLRDAAAEQLGLTMLDQSDFLKLTRVNQLSVPRVLVFDRAGKPNAVIAGAVAGGRDLRLADAIEKVVG
ncbi:TlpA disulfide reductase family protein [Sphingosinicella sp. BN140058]|uniref:TlpA disulfide reductase family protein n=1 Tax=Sphingosinicella sp. BN140058 TaxID=1892855 RepID=UPI001013128C|nr:TlpA disulfide reductase family protein [Sphingosinicella sp. BN140058]QAY78275.1 TlpA family protein disulfide reductase [Sphingosinicella sp. BN140058]